jgi:hypothetical protein
MEIFPEIQGQDLLGDNIKIPSQLKGELNIIIIAFQRWQQDLIDSWNLFLEYLLRKYPKLEFYEFPIIRKMNFIYRAFINRGMRMGIPSEKTRSRTITLYIDKEPFKTALNIKTEDNIFLFLIDKTGNILWRSQSYYTEGKGLELLEVIKKRIKS